MKSSCYGRSRHDFVLQLFPNADKVRWKEARVGERHLITFTSKFVSRLTPCASYRFILHRCKYSPGDTGPQLHVYFSHTKVVLITLSEDTLIPSKSFRSCGNNIISVIFRFSAPYSSTLPLASTTQQNDLTWICFGVVLARGDFRFVSTFP